MARTDADEIPFKIEDPPEGSLNWFSIKVLSQAKDQILVDCNGIAGNRPMSNENSIALWDTTVPTTKDRPLRLYHCKTEDQPNRRTLQFEFEPLNYGLTYQVGPDATTMCALAVIANAPTAIAALPLDVRLTLRAVTRTSIQVQYSVLSGYLPRANGNWIGLWHGSASPYTGVRPAASLDIPDDQNMGVVTLDNLNILTDFSYTLVYVMKQPGTPGMPLAAGSILYFST